MVPKGHVAFGKRLGSFGTSLTPSQSGLYPLCTASATSLTPFYDGFILLYGRQCDYHISCSKSIASICLMVHTPNFA